MIKKKVELLSPAGNLEKLKWALDYGADAVYLGGQDYSLRANAANFSISDIKEGCEYAHNLGKKVYVTVNIVFHNEDIDGLVVYLKKLEEIGVDAIIVSDLIVVELIKKNKINLEFHISTQSSTMNLEAIEFYKKIGASRVVLGRECNKEDLLEITSSTDMEIEIFIHGAMCVGYSGRCVLSNYMTNRDSNRGGCSQICRWEFNLVKDGMVIDDPTKFSMSTKDLSMLKPLGELIDMGITSLKIEGRMRSIYYIATVVNTYRKVIDEYYHNKNSYEYNEYYESVLRGCANRDSVPQFYYNIPGSEEQYYLGREEVSNQDFLGIVLSYNKKTKIAVVEQRNHFKPGDVIKVFGPITEEFIFKIEEIFTEDGTILDAARHAKMVVKLKMPRPVNKFDILKINSE